MPSIFTVTLIRELICSIHVIIKHLAISGFSQTLNLIDYEALSNFIYHYLIRPALTTSFSACTKDDINFYLDKGFTQEQITQLCSASGGGTGTTEAVPDYTPYQQKVIIYQDGGGPEIDKDGFSKEERLAINDLKAGGDIIKLKVTDTHINYQCEKFVLFQETILNFHQRYKTCPEVAFKVARDGLIAASSGKKLLIFGTAVVTLEGKIDRKLLGKLGRLPIKCTKRTKTKF